jgi:magnesium-transporting ATPase (P-type)
MDNKKNNPKNKILNKHFFKLVGTFILIIIFISTFVSFIEEMQSKNKNEINQKK